MHNHIHTLLNGIRLIHVPTLSNISHVCILIHAGSRDEEQGKEGLAHFIEHLLFKRTRKRNTSQILNRLEGVGADLNAYTTKEYTCLHASFLNSYLGRTLDLFEDVIFNSTFPETEMAKEVEVILDEITSYQDQPDEAIQEDFEELIFAGHPLGKSILGTAQSIRSFQREDIFYFMQTHYHLNELVNGVYGKYDFKKIVRMVERLFGDKSSFPSIPIHGRIKPQPSAPQTMRFQKPINQAHCVLGRQAYSLHATRKFGLLLLNNLLGGIGMSSRLNLEIREKRGIAYIIESNYTPLSDTGIFSIYFGTDIEKTEKAIALIHQELKKLCHTPLGKIQLHQAKQKFIGQIALAEENRMGLLLSMSKNIMDYNRVEPLEEIFAKINDIKSSDLLDIANEIFDPKQLNMLLFEPLSAT